MSSATTMSRTSLAYEVWPTLVLGVPVSCPWQFLQESHFLKNPADNPRTNTAQNSQHVRECLEPSLQQLRKVLSSCQQCYVFCPIRASAHSAEHVWPTTFVSLSIYVYLPDGIEPIVVPH